MTNSGQGMMIVLSSPSGAGKTTLARMLDEKNANFSISISHTTRTSRHNEVEGKDYHFVKKDLTYQKWVKDFPSLKKFKNPQSILRNAKIKHTFNLNFNNWLQELRKIIHG